MGQWNVLSINCRHKPLNTPSNFGTEWFVTYKLKYTPSMIGNFTEPPKMDWDETILFVDRAKQEWWEFRGNFYTQKPDSPTMAVWAQRYHRAYLHAHKEPFTGSFGEAKGHSKLFDKNNVPVTAQALGKHMGVDAQNKAVQKYLKDKGGILEIEVHDVPSLNKVLAGGTAKDIERVLIFNCGVEGSGMRAKGWQHVKMDSSQPASSWHYEFQTAGSAPGLKTTGMKKVPDPTPKSNMLPTGGIW